MHFLQVKYTKNNFNIKNNQRGYDFFQTMDYLLVK